MKAKDLLDIYKGGHWPFCVSLLTDRCFERTKLRPILFTFSNNGVLLRIPCCTKRWTEKLGHHILCYVTSCLSVIFFKECWFIGQNYSLVNVHCSFGCTNELFNLSDNENDVFFFRCRF